MIHYLYIFDGKSNTLLYEKNFTMSKDDEKMDMFDSFFTALKSFISGMVVDGSTELKNIKLGEYTVLIRRIEEIRGDVVIIVDDDNIKTIKKTMPKLIDVIIPHKEIFVEKNVQTDKLEEFDKAITNFLLNKTKLVDKSVFLEHQEDIIKSIWAQRGNITSHLREDLLKEQDELLKTIESTENFPEKFSSLEKLIEISDKLKDEIKFMEYQNQIKILKKEIKDKKIRLDYYFDKVKNALNPAGIKKRNFKDGYISLYSLSSKLKNYATAQECERFLLLSKKLMEQVESESPELLETVKEIMETINEFERIY